MRALMRGRKHESQCQGSLDDERLLEGGDLEVGGKVDFEDWSVATLLLEIHCPYTRSASLEVWRVHLVGGRRGVGFLVWRALRRARVHMCTQSATATGSSMAEGISAARAQLFEAGL